MLKYLTAAALILGSAMSANAVNNDDHNRAVRVCNQANSRIVHVFATNKSETSWGRDLLIGNIPPGSCRTIEPPEVNGYCVFDWRAELADGSYAEKRFDACSQDTWTIFGR